MIQLVEEAHFTPGCCMRCRTSTGPFADLGPVDDWTRLYLCGDCAGEVVVQFGGTTPHGVGAFEERIGALEQELLVQTGVIERQEAALADAERLRASVAYTLEHGAVADKRSGRLKPRPVPGERAVDVEAAIEA